MLTEPPLADNDALAMPLNVPPVLEAVSIERHRVPVMVTPSTVPAMKQSSGGPPSVMVPLRSDPVREPPKRDSVAESKAMLEVDEHVPL
jgi:hypothetical protein